MADTAASRANAWLKTQDFATNVPTTRKATLREIGRLSGQRNLAVDFLRELLIERNAAIARLAEAQTNATETALELGDMEDQRNAVYRERAHLVALLAAEDPSHIGRNDPNAPDWAVLTVELPTGQACWHIAAADMDLFAHVQPTPNYARGWDGHTTEEKYQRIREHTTARAAAPAILDSLRQRNPPAPAHLLTTHDRLPEGEGPC